MKHHIKILFLASLLVTIQSQAKIIESNKLSDVNKYVDKNTVVLWDIDETLLRTPQYLGSDPWLKYHIGNLEKKGLCKSNALDYSMYLQLIIYRSLRMKLVDNSAPVIIKNLQAKNIHTMAVTHRAIFVMKKTIKQLKRAGIDFSKDPLFNKNLDLSEKYIGKSTLGILFTGDNPKGKILFSFFKKVGYKPTKIIMVDDELKNLQDIEREAKKHGVAFIGIRFSKLDTWKKKFNRILGEKQLHDFKVKIGLAPLPQKLASNKISPAQAPSLKILPAVIPTKKPTIITPNKIPIKTPNKNLSK